MQFEFQTEMDAEAEQVLLESWLPAVARVLEHALGDPRAEGDVHVVLPAKKDHSTRFPPRIEELASLIGLSAGSRPLGPTA
jgi:hypothetical protein